jgi:hypothetical protein
MKEKPKPDNPEQSRRFEEKARELGMDESGKRFEKAMSVIAPPKRRHKAGDAKPRVQRPPR